MKISSTDWDQQGSSSVVLKESLSKICPQLELQQVHALLEVIENHHEQRKINSTQLVWYMLTSKLKNLLGTSSHRTDVTQAAEKELLSLSYLAPYLLQDTNQKTCNCKTTKLTRRRHGFLCLNAIYKHSRLISFLRTHSQQGFGAYVTEYI